MKKKLLIGALSFISCLSILSQNIKVDTVNVNKDGLENLLVEQIPVPAGAGAPENSVTYRLFVDLKPGYKFNGCKGLNESKTHLTIKSSESFFNHNQGTGKGSDASPDYYLFAPGLEYDSYATDGRIGTAYIGVLRSVNPAGRAGLTVETTPAKDLEFIGDKIDILTANDAKELHDYNKGWNVDGGIGGPDADANIIFIGQFTTAGKLEMSLNLSVSSPSGTPSDIARIVYPVKPGSPVVEITEPENNSVYQIGETIDIKAEVSGGTADSVVFFADELQIGSDNTAPFSIQLTPDKTGDIKLIAVAHYKERIVTQETADTVSIKIVSNPEISISSPNDGDTFNEKEDIEIKTDITNDEIIDSVVFFANNSKIGLSSKKPFQLTWHADITGSIKLLATAFYNKGKHVSSKEIGVNIALNPKVTITSPKNGDNFMKGDKVKISADITTAGKIDSVVFYADSYKISIDKNPPYETIWDAFRTGNIKLTAEAYYNKGENKSDNVSVNVKENTPSESNVDTVKVNLHGLEKLIVEKIDVPKDIKDIPEGTVTYRLFVDLKPEYKFISCAGSDKPLTYLTIKSSKPFYNHPQGTDKGEGAAPGFYALAPSLEYDSYVTDGRIGNAYVGVLKSINPLGRIDLTPSTTPIGGSLVVPKDIDILKSDTATILNDYLSYWGVAGGIGGPDAEENIVFIGQLTTAGELKMRLNISVKNPHGGLATARNILYNFAAPSIKITSPANNAMLQLDQEKQILVEASDDDGKVDSVEFFINDTKVGTSISSPYNFTWETDKEGTFKIKARATDNDGYTNSDSISVTLVDGNPPVIKILSPAKDEEIAENSTVTLKAEAKDSDGSVDSVAFYMDDKLITTVKAAPFEYKWKAKSINEHHLKAIAFDNTSLTDTSSVSFKVVKASSINLTKNTENPIVTIYPVPVKDALTVEINSENAAEKFKLKVINISTGKILRTFDLGSIAPEFKKSFNLSGLIDGVYILNISSDKGFNTYKYITKH